MAISSLGVGSGLDLSSIVSNLVSAEAVPTENRLFRQEADVTTELSAFGALRSSLSLFQGSLANLQSSTVFDAKKFTISDSSIFTATTENSADPGNYSIEVSAIAQAQSLATSAATAFTDVSDTIGTGTLTIQFGETSTGPYAFTQDTSKATQTITVSAANNNTTLSGMRDYINDNDFGVQASIVNDGNGYRLLLTSESTGAKNSMQITVTSDGDGNDNDNSGLSQLAFNASAQTSVTQTVAAQDAALSINGLDITRETNTVSGAISGVTLDLLKAEVGSLVKFNVSENSQPAKNSINEFVTNYNDLITNMNALTAYDAETGSAGILIGDFTVRSLSTQLRSVISDAVSQLSGDLRSLADLGITTNSSTGTLDVDETILDDALSNFPEQVEALFGRQGRPSDSEINYISGTVDTSAGDYSVDITTLATQGEFNGTTVNALIIDGNNDNFTLKADGATSSSITLAQGTYADGDALAAHIQAQINDDNTLKGAGASVSVVYDSVNNEFDITSTKYGSASNVEFTVIDTNTSNDLGFSVASGTAGVDVAGTINGIAATGSGRQLTSDNGDSKGLVLEVVGGITGNRGTVSYSQGLGFTIDDIMNNFLGSDGLIASREDGLNDTLEDIAEQRVSLNMRLESLEARLIKQFAALDLLIAQFNQTSNFLTQQLASLPKPNSIGNN